MPQNSPWPVGLGQQGLDFAKIPDDAAGREGKTAISAPCAGLESPS